MGANIGIIGAQGHLGQSLTRKLEKIKPASVNIIGTTDKDHNPEIAAQSDLLVICVRPQHVASLLSEIRDSLKKDAQILSFAAGVAIKDMEKASGRPAARAMADPWWQFAGFVFGENFSKNNYEFIFDKLTNKIIPLAGESDIDEFTAYFVHAYIALFLKASNLLPTAREHLEYLAPHLNSSIDELENCLPTGDPEELLRKLATPGGVTEAVLQAIQNDAGISPAAAHSAGIERLHTISIS